MTSEKLTAKLSDGREGEVISISNGARGMRSGTAYVDETIHLVIKLLKPSPPKEVWIMTGPDGKKDLYTYEHNALFNQGPRDSIARYILAPEKEETPTEKFIRLGNELINQPNATVAALKPKPAREWWLVHDNQLCRLVVFGSKEKANEVYPLNEVVHVREVVSDD